MDFYIEEGHEAVVSKVLYLTTPEQRRASSRNTTVLYERYGLKVIGRELPAMRDFAFSYDGRDSYRFGCSDGRFDYSRLTNAIDQLRGEKKVKVLVKKNAKNGSVVTSPVISESDAFYITENRKAYAKSEYEFKEVAANGVFELNGDMVEYGHRTLGRRDTVLAILLTAKTVIDFIERQDSSSSERIFLTDAEMKLIIDNRVEAANKEASH